MVRRSASDRTSFKGVSFCLLRALLTGIRDLRLDSGIDSSGTCETGLEHCAGEDENRWMCLRALSYGYSLKLEEVPALIQKKMGFKVSPSGLATDPNGNSDPASSEESVNQEPVVPELNPPLLEDDVRRQELNDRLGICLGWFILSNRGSKFNCGDATPD